MTFERLNVGIEAQQVGRLKAMIHKTIPQDIDIVSARPVYAPMNGTKHKSTPTACAEALTAWRMAIENRPKSTMNRVLLDVAEVNLHQTPFIES
jgi:hypothetical protein